MSELEERRFKSKKRNQEEKKLNNKEKIIQNCYQNWDKRNNNQLPQQQVENQKKRRPNTHTQKIPRPPLQQKALNQYKHNKKVQQHKHKLNQQLKLKQNQVPHLNHNKNKRHLRKMPSHHNLNNKLQKPEEMIKRKLNLKRKPSENDLKIMECMIFLIVVQALWEMWV